MNPKAIVSIHDVEPATLPSVHEIVGVLRAAGVGPVTLLVVPGVDWSTSDIDVVRSFAADGCGVAGHGWEHQAVPPRTLFHRLHSRTISRDQAEHLSRTRDDLRAIVSRCHRWFNDVGLPSPELYVPPAWALGRLARGDLRDLPFLWYETLTGCIDARAGELRPMALVGYEADNLSRKLALRATNGLNRGLARIGLDPLRIAIHPKDLGLRLAEDIPRVLTGPWEYTTVEAVMSARRLGAGPRAAATG